MLESRDLNLEGTLDRVTFGKAFENMTPKHRRLIELHYIQGFEQSDIAKMKSVSVGSIKSSMHRGLDELRALLTGKSEERIESKSGTPPMVRENTTPAGASGTNAVLAPEIPSGSATKSKSGLNEPSLIDEVIKGNMEAFAALHRKNAPIVFKFLQGILRNDATAEDLTQTVFLRWFKRIQVGAYDHTAPLLSYLLKIATNLARNEVRDRENVPGFRKSDASLDEMFLLKRPENEKAIGTAVDVERFFSRRDPGLEGTPDRLTLERAMQNLSPENREILELHFYAGLKIREIAEKMHRPLPAVQSQLYRALSSLQGFIPRKRSHSLAAAKAEVDPIDELPKEPVAIKTMAKAAGR